jgi:hypothetical protein
MSKNRSARALALWAGACLAILCLALLAGVRAQGQGAAQAAPKYKFDPDWPKPLPNKWKLGGVTGWLWIRMTTRLGAQSFERSDERQTRLNSIPIADCCVHPQVIRFDKAGNVIGSLTPGRHGRG